MPSCTKKNLLVCAEQLFYITHRILIVLQPAQAANQINFTAETQRTLWRMGQTAASGFISVHLWLDHLGVLCDLCGSTLHHVHLNGIVQVGFPIELNGNEASR